MRVAKIREEKFDAAVEADKPATVTALGEVGEAGSPKHNCVLRGAALE
jgi:hypothetical protein